MVKLSPCFIFVCVYVGVAVCRHSLCLSILSDSLTCEIQTAMNRKKKKNRRTTLIHAVTIVHNHIHCPFPVRD